MDPPRLLGELALISPPVSFNHFNVSVRLGCMSTIKCRLSPVVFAVMVLRVSSAPYKVRSPVSVTPALVIVQSELTSNVPVDSGDAAVQLQLTGVTGVHPVP